MPTGKRNHPTSKSVICFGCGKKDLNLKCLLDNPFLIKLIKEHIDCGFNPELNEHPTGLCNTCKTHLCAAQVCKFKFTF